VVLFQIVITNCVMLNKETVRSELNAVHNNELFNSVTISGIFIKFLNANDLTDTKPL